MYIVLYLLSFSNLNLTAKDHDTCFITNTNQQHFLQRQNTNTKFVNFEELKGMLPKNLNIQMFMYSVSQLLQIE